MKKLKTKIWGETYGVRADWAQASDQVQALNSDGEWQSTQFQVADFRHSPEAALRRVLEDTAKIAGDLDDEVREEMEEALKNAVED